MCKVMIMGGIKKRNASNALKFVRVMGPLMSKYNTDGIGYTAVDSNGDMYGQRWWHNNHFMKKNSGVLSEEPDELKQYNSFLSETYGYAGTNSDYMSSSTNEFGKINHEDMVAITLHTRMATSGKEFANTHPFVYPEQDTSLIHNGIIHNVKDFDLKVSTCDSEAILISYLKHQVNLDPNNVLELAKELNGYYMAGVFSRDSEGKRVLDLIKHNANLFASYVKELGTVVFSTSDDDIKAACSELGFSFTKPKTVKQDVLLRMNPFTGELTAKYEWYYPEKKSTTQTTHTGKNSGMSSWRKFSKKELGGMTDEMFNYLKLTPAVETYNEMEMVELVRSLGLDAKNV